MKIRLLLPLALLAMPVAAGATTAPGTAPRGGVQPGDPAQLECLALNVYWEARSEPEREQAAVAHVTMNRVASPDFPDTICDVVRQGGETIDQCQFSWRCDGAPDEPENAEAWAEAMRIAKAVIEGSMPDPTDGALYFHGHGSTPDWAAEMQQTAALGAHIFYK